MIRNSVLLLLLFPYVGFFPTDIQPGFIVLAVVGLITGTPQRLSSFDRLFITVNLALIVVYLLVYDSRIDLRALFTWILFSVMPVAVAYFKGLDRKATTDWLTSCMVLLLIVGVVQLFHPDFASFLVSREVDQDLVVASGRGVRSLTSEPSVFSRVLSKLALGIIIVAGYRPLRQFIIFVINSFLTLSVYGIALHAMVLFFASEKFRLKLIVFTVILVIVTWIPIPGRAGYILNGLKDNPELLLTQGAFARVVNLPISVENTFRYWPEGSAVKIIEGTKAILETPIGAYMYTVAPRNLGGIIELPYRFGFLGLLSLITFTFYFLILTQNYRFKGVRWLVLLMFFQDSSIVDPFNWILLVLITQYRSIDLNFKMSKNEANC